MHLKLTQLVSVVLLLTGSARGADPQLRSGKADARGVIPFIITAVPESVVQLQISLDLKTWLGLDFATATNGTAQFQDGLAAQDAARFYRALTVDPTNAPAPLSVRPVRASGTGRSAADEIGPAGGGLIVTNAAGAVCLLNVPANALAEPVLLTLTALAELSGLPGDAKLIHGFVLEPAGLGFGTPVTLHITPPAGQTLPADVRGAVGDVDGTEFHLDVTTGTEGAVDFHLLSTGPSAIVGGGATAWAGFRDHRPSSLFARRAQEFVLFGPAGILSARRPLPATPPTHKQLIESATADFTALVLPALQLAEQNDDILPTAVSAVAKWYRELDFLGLTEADVAPINDAIGELVRDAFDAGVNRATERCSRHDLEQIAHLVRLGRYLNFPDVQRFVTPGLKELLQGKIRACASFDLSFKSLSTAFLGDATFSSLVETHVPVHYGNGIAGGIGGSRELPFTLLEGAGLPCHPVTSSTSGFLRVDDVRLGLNLDGKQRPQYQQPPPLQQLDVRLDPGFPQEQFTLPCSPVALAIGPFWITFFGGAYGSEAKEFDGIAGYVFTGWEKGGDDIVATKTEDATIKSDGKTVGTIHIELQLRHTPAE